MGLTERFGDVDAGTVRTFLLGDLLALSVFLLLGELRHGFHPLDVPVRVALVALPFLLSWVVLGSLAGAYSAGLADSPRALLATTLLGWLLADAAGQALRATGPLPGNADPAFFAVAFAFGAALLVLWRGARAVLRRFVG
jgi:hypothetical protein